MKNVQLYEHGRGVLRPRRQEAARRSAARLAGGAWRAPCGDAGMERRSLLAFDFFDAKGVVENLMRELAHPEGRATRRSSAQRGPAPAARPRGSPCSPAAPVLGWVGELHPLAVRRLMMPRRPWSPSSWTSRRSPRPAAPRATTSTCPRSPAVSIDQAFVVDEDVTHERLEQCMSSAGGKLLAEVRLFDVYRDSERIGAGQEVHGVRADVSRRRSHAYQRRG